MKSVLTMKPRTKFVFTKRNGPKVCIAYDRILRQDPTPAPEVPYERFPLDMAAYAACLAWLPPRDLLEEQTS